MAYQFKLQVPISEELNDQLKKKSQQIGFSSVNEVARLLLTNFVNGNLSLSFVESKPVENIPNEELEKIIAKGIAEYNKGKTKKLNLSKSVHQQLLED
jgi:hypothetical protein